jgi:hypothetical protein
MIRLMLDHFRRWSWVLALTAALAFSLGWFVCTADGQSCAFYVLLVSMWAGATLLSFDMKHGLVRTILALPLTARQIGRAWWFATVGIPALAMVVLMLSGAALWSRFHPGKSVPVSVLAVSCLFCLLWLGNGFTMIYGMTNEMFGSRRQRLCLTGISLLSMIMLFGGMFLAFELFEKPVLLAVFIGIGLIVTSASWLRAERFVLGQASFRLATVAGQSRFTGASHHPSVGCGGIAYLLRVSIIRTFSYLAAMVALMTLLTLFLPVVLPNMRMIMLTQMGSFMSLFLMVLFLVMPVLQQLRLWRTLPISTTRLAALIIALAILPLIAVGVAGAVVADFAWGRAAAIMTIKSYMFILAPAALSVFLATWRRTGRGVYLLTSVIVLSCGLLGPLTDERLLHHPIPLLLSSALVAAFVLLCFFLTRLGLVRSSQPYRAQIVPTSPAGI